MGRVRCGLWGRTSGGYIHRAQYKIGRHGALARTAGVSSSGPGAHSPHRVRPGDGYQIHIGCSIATRSNPPTLHPNHLQRPTSLGHQYMRGSPRLSLSLASMIQGRRHNQHRRVHTGPIDVFYSSLQPALGSRFFPRLVSPISQNVPPTSDRSLTRGSPPPLPIPHRRAIEISPMGRTHP